MLVPYKITKFLLVTVAQKYLIFQHSYRLFGEIVIYPPITLFRRPLNFNKQINIFLINNFISIECYLSCLNVAIFSLILCLFYFFLFFFFFL